MLTTLRNSAQSWLIKVLLGIIVVTFVISFGVGTFSNPKEVLVEVGNHEIMVSQYLNRYQQEMDRLRRQAGDNAEALANQLNLREQVMNGLVNRYLLLQAAKRQGFQVTNEELRQAVTSNAVFQRNGRFDFETYRTILRQNGTSPAEYEANLRQDLLLAKQQRQLLAGVIVNDAEIEQRYKVEHQQVEVRYIFVKPDAFPLKQQPTEEAQQAYYDAHKEAFTQPEQFKLRYFTLSVNDLADRSEISDRAVERYYERNRDTEFTKPKRVKASHILKRLPQDASPEEVAKARDEMADVVKQARGGAGFGELARKYSDDMTKEQGGDLGFFTHDEMVPAFADAAFGLKKGEISDLVRSPFGLHIIKVTDIQPAVHQPLDDVREQIVDDLVQQRAERKLELEQERLPNRLQRDGMEAVAKDFGKTVQTTEFFDSGSVLPALGSMAPVYNRLQSRKVGDVGVWRRNPVQGHVFYEVSDRKESYVRPFDEVRKQVAELTAADQRREKALAAAKEAYGKIKATADFQAFAKRHGLEVKTVAFTAVDNALEGLGINRDFQRTAFRLNEDNPFGLSIKDNQAFLLEYQRRFFPEPDKAEEQKQQIAQRMRNALQQYVLQNEVERLRGQVEVNVKAPEYLLAGTSGAPQRTAY